MSLTENVNYFKILFIAGKMPAPEQTPLVEDGLPQTAQETSTVPGMEPETTATTILASVKEQVYALLLAIQKSSMHFRINHCLFCIAGKKHCFWNLFPTVSIVHFVCQNGGIWKGSLDCNKQKHHYGILYQM